MKYTNTKQKCITEEEGEISFTTSDVGFTNQDSGDCDALQDSHSTIDNGEQDCKYIIEITTRLPWQRAFQI